MSNVSKMNSIKIVEDFWAAVWQAPQDVDAIDRFVVDNFRPYHRRCRHCDEG